MIDITAPNPLRLALFLTVAIAAAGLSGLNGSPAHAVAADSIKVANAVVTVQAGSPLNNSGRFNATFANPVIHCNLAGQVNFGATISGHNYSVSIPTTVNTGSGPAACRLFNGATLVAVATWEAVINGSANTILPATPQGVSPGTSVALTGSYTSVVSPPTIVCRTVLTASTFPTRVINATLNTISHTFSATIPTAATTATESWRCELDGANPHDILATSAAFPVTVLPTGSISVNSATVTAQAGNPLTNSGTFSTPSANKFVSCSINGQPAVVATLTGSTFSVSIPTTPNTGSGPAQCNLVVDSAVVSTAPWEGVITGSNNTIHANPPTAVTAGTPAALTGTFTSSASTLAIICRASLTTSSFPTTPVAATFNTNTHTFSATIPTAPTTVTEDWRCALNSTSTSTTLATSTPFAVPVGANRTVSVSWSASEDARLSQMGLSMGPLTAAKVQKASVYIISFILGFDTAAPTPVTLDPPGTAVTYSDVWTPDEFSILDAVKAKYALNDSDATRFAAKLIDFLLGLGGH